MGLLDDAIREHLELKRRRGADLDEVARQEGEALGDPRGGAFAQPVAVPEDDGDVSPDPAPLPEEPAGAYAAPHDEEQAGAHAAPDDPAPHDEEPWLDADERPDQPTAELAPPPVEPAHERPVAEPTADEDVLEETPDFLQETPEHDRLWFEQKPPRDFDFDR